MCPDPAVPTNGYIEVSPFSDQYKYGSVASYKCNPGYRITDAVSEMVCGEEGTWIRKSSSEDAKSKHLATTAASTPSCAPQPCVDPPPVEHAVMELINGSMNFNSLLVYSCEAGYYDQDYPHSATLSQCQANMKWSPVSLR